MKGYKGFKAGLVCDPTGDKPFQYTENTVFEQEDDAEICKSGFHFCKYPLDVLEYYPLVDENGNLNEFAEVEALDKCVTDNEKKYCTKKIKIDSKLSFQALIQAGIEVALEKTIKKRVIESGNYAQIGSSGNDAQIGSSGYGARIGSSGDDAQIVSAGSGSVICCAGHNSKVKAKKGSWITLAEWEIIDGSHIPKCVKTEYVDGERIKEDVFYRLKDGEFVEVEEN